MKNLPEVLTKVLLDVRDAVQNGALGVELHHIANKQEEYMMMPFSDLKGNSANPKCDNGWT
jgi:hypothetical protein